MGSFYHPLIYRVLTAQGKWPKNNPPGKNREFGNVTKIQGNMFAQVVNSLILNIQDIEIFATNFSKSVLLMKLSKFLKWVKLKFPVGQGKQGICN